MNDLFRENLLTYFDDLYAQVATQNGEWTVRGFIDVYQRIYAISLDTKVLSKVIEFLFLPILQRFAHEHNYEIILPSFQNQYPDLSLIERDTRTTYAVDIKTTYRIGKDKVGQEKVNGMTLGTYTGYFRNRQSTSQTPFPYVNYFKHYVLGVVYTPLTHQVSPEVYQLHQLNDIPAVAQDFVFFLQEKYRIASDRPGSGNTKNIGSTVYLERLVNGTGVFAPLGIEVFDDYWMNYRNREMARAEGFTEVPYANLLQYKAFKSRGAQILNTTDIQTEDTPDNPPTID
jgi:hypothetical protein